MGYLKVVLIIIGMCYVVQIKGQTYDYTNTTMANFLQRHYESQPFDGLREVEDYQNKYLECVLTISKERENDSNIGRVLFLKASRMVSEYENGVHIIEVKPISMTDTIQSSSTMIVTTTGITGSLRLLTSFCHKDKLVYIYLKKIQ